MLGIIYSGFAMLASYRIIRIEDDPTPLAAGTHSTGIYSRAVQEGYYGDTLAAMLLIGLILMATAYILLCIRYRKRIRELQPGEQPGEHPGEHPGWNWWKLRRQITELEYQKAEGIVEDIRKAAEGYMTV
mgnify:CR=1 FL=1